MRERSCCFTGHRVIPAEEKEEVAKRLSRMIERLIVERGVEVFWAGGALGFDMLAAESVLSLKRKHPHIRLHLILPCPEQADRWNASSIAKYRRILQSADYVEYASPTYVVGCMHERNRRLVYQSKYCLCYLTKNAGGTAYTVSRAEKEGLALINVAYQTV